MTGDGDLESLYLPAAERALEHFPVEPEAIELVAFSENVTFRVSTRHREADYVLRLHRPGYNAIGELDSERLWAGALKDAGLCIQDSLPTRQGQYFVPIDIPGAGEQRYAGMTSWLEGMLLSDCLEAKPGPADRARVFHEIGAIAAAIHNQSAAWNVPPGFTRRRLDLDGLLGEQPHWGRFWEHPDLNRAEGAALLHKRNEVGKVLRAYGETADNFSLIHADLDPDNIIQHGDDMALIDFDDAAFGWHLYDLASALLEYRSAPDFEALSAALLDGYRQHRPLAERDIEMLPAFLLVRGMATIGWFLQRPEHADSGYFEALRDWLLDASVTGGRVRLAGDALTR
jgi:Ser/Thr protein kinase RdoA (MazF antagonist)